MVACQLNQVAGAVFSQVMAVASLSVDFEVATCW
jgi:hypothetical protein